MVAIAVVLVYGYGLVNVSEVEVLKYDISCKTGSSLHTSHETKLIQDKGVVGHH